MNVQQQLHSIVVPVYGCHKVLQELSERIHDVYNNLQIDYELIFIDDNPTSSSWEVIKSLTKESSNIVGYKLSRNFGQHYAITAGLEKSKGDYIVVMDCDLQDVPEEIISLYHKINEGYDLVIASRKKRKDKKSKILGSFIFYKLFAYLTDTPQDHSIGNFGMYKKKVIEAVLSMNDHIKLFPVMIQWVGFNKAVLEVKHSGRKEGKSSYTIFKLFKLAFDTIISFSDKPLRITIKFGLIVSLSSVFIGTFYLFRYLNGQIEQLGYTSLILSIWFLSGIIIVILGIIGMYIGKMFDKVKMRPDYIISESTIDIEHTKS